MQYLRIIYYKALNSLLLTHIVRKMQIVSRVEIICKLYISTSLLNTVCSCFTVLPHSSCHTAIKSVCNSCSVWNVSYRKNELSQYQEWKMKANGLHTLITTAKTHTTFKIDWSETLKTLDPTSPIMHLGSASIRPTVQVNLNIFHTPLLPFATCFLLYVYCLQTQTKITLMTSLLHHQGYFLLQSYRWHHTTVFTPLTMMCDLISMCKVTGGTFQHTLKRRDENMISRLYYSL